MLNLPTEALRPCPFCGCGTLAKIQYVRDGQQVRCQCGAAGPAEFHGPPTMPNAERRAADRWNARSPDPEAWQDIETAPEGCMCLFADMTAAEARNWAFVDWMVGGQFCGDRKRTATHWKSLPEPPSKSSPALGDAP